MTISNPDIKVPNREAWKTDDKVWTKQRREQWKNIKISLNRIAGLKAHNIKYLKQYYLTGLEADFFPLISWEFKEGLLYELWFHPDQSVKNWELLRERQRDWVRFEKEKRYHHSLEDEVDIRVQEAKRIFLYYSNLISPGEDDQFPKTQVSFFCGLEESLFHFLCPEMQSFNRERFKSNITDEEFLEEAYGHYQTGALNCLLYLEMPKENVNPYVISRWRVPEFHDAILIGYRDRPEFEWLIDLVDAVLADPNGFHETQVQLAEEVQEVLNDPKLPQEAKDKIVEVRSRTGE